MKKIITICLCLLLSLYFYERQKPVDLSKYESDSKRVEIKGEVITPGIYDVDLHANVNDVIRLAGGCRPDADTSNLNLTKDIANHEVIVVAKKSEVVLISINSAKVEDLDTLPGIGPSIAQRIVDYRSQNAFSSLEQLKEVKGIGDKLFDKIKDLITL